LSKINQNEVYEKKLELANNFQENTVDYSLVVSGVQRRQTDLPTDGRNKFSSRSWGFRTNINASNGKIKGNLSL
jgi:hypothetical protein